MRRVVKDNSLMSKVAFVGLGNMGLGMARRLLEAGHNLNVHNRTASRAAALVRQGATFFETPLTACTGADVIVSMVADDLASRSVWLGPHGILAAKTAANALAVECSTLSHAWVMELSSEVKRRGFRYLDAPVTGLPDAAAAGDLTLLVGADAEDLETARYLLAAFSKRIIRFGEIGAGTAYKLIVNMLGAVQIASAAEAMAIAERAGLDLYVVAEAIAAGQAASPQVIRNTRRMADNDHKRNVVFTPALRLKDVQYGLKLAQNLGIGSPFSSLAGAKFHQLCELGFVDDNESSIIDVARREGPGRS
jgi:3-hydroxyisobutyrate dehydrogenase